MLFNSFTFAVFLPVVFLLYWLVRSRRLRTQNFILLVARYVFYGWWDVRFLALIVASSIVDYGVGLALGSAENPRWRRFLLGVSLAANLGLLGFFKYYGFFVESFASLVQALGLQADIHALQIILPVGISFYTFQTMSYTIDVYRRQFEPTRDVIAFFAFVSFFPQLVAGPIERASNLLPQFLERRRFDVAQAKDGLRQALWGLFKKTVIADNLAGYVDTVFTDYRQLGAPALVLGVVYFAIQIYCDFSGYSDIAIGTARLFGFRLQRNFAVPYFSRDIGEFWRRWHISLSTWFRDYVYIPLGGSRTKTRSRHVANLLITFTISGLWHGANWTFVFWGFLNGLYYVPLVLWGKHKVHTDTVAAERLLPSLRETLQMGVTFCLVLFGWVFFRADSIGHATDYLAQAVRSGSAGSPTLWQGLPCIVVVLLVEGVQRTRQHALEIAHLPCWARWIIYYTVIAAIFCFGVTGYVPFIYFQF